MDDVNELFAKMPMFSFKDAEDVEVSLQPGEICVAVIPNINPIGFEKHVALAYKDHNDNVYSITLNQHHGVMKDTPENRAYLAGLDPVVETQETVEKPENVVEFKKEK